MASRKAEARRDRRAPMGLAAHETDRAARGRTSSSKTPVQLRNTTSEPLDKEWVHQRLGFKLGKFAARIDRADINVAGETGAVGAPAFRATIQLMIARHDPIVVTARGRTPQAAVSAALQSCERTMRRSLERREAGRTRTAGAKRGRR
jgi:ribosome-associated translation inhibitor RaiA